MIGLRFKIKNEYGNYLKKILSSIDIQNYEWDIITDDIIDFENPEKNGIFDSDIIDGRAFQNSIEKENYYMIFVDLKAFPISSKHVEIQNFNDFINSDCQIILLCVDSEFIYFFCKEASILKTVYNNCIFFGFEAVRYIYLDEAFELGVIAF